MCIDGIDYGVRFALAQRQLIQLFQQGRVCIYSNAESQMHYMMWLEQYLRQESAVKIRLIHYGWGGTLSGCKPSKIRAIKRLALRAWQQTMETTFVLPRPLDLTEHFVRYFQSPYRPPFIIVDPEFHLVHEAIVQDDIPDLIPILSLEQREQREQQEEQREALLQEEREQSQQSQQQEQQAQPEDNWMEFLVDVHPHTFFRPVPPLFDSPPPRGPAPIEFHLYTQEEKWSPPENTCCICLTNAPFIQTQCGHAFCGCIATHLMQFQKTQCPLCREQVAQLTMHDERAYQSFKSVECLFPEHVVFVS